MYDADRIIRILWHMIRTEMQGISISNFLLGSAAACLAAFIVNKCVTTFTDKKAAAMAVYPLLIYMVFMAQLTYFRRMPESRFGVNLELIGQESLSQFVYLFLNTLLFVPYGFLLGLLTRRGAALKILLVGCYGFLSSLFIEICQLLTGRGYFEVSDLLTNTAGCLLGALPTLLIGYIRVRRAKRHGHAIP